MSQRTSYAFIRYGLLVVLGAAALIICVPAEAGYGPGGGGGGGGEVETTGNNLSYPVVLVDGATLSLREPPTGVDYSLLGYYWIGWIDPITGTQLACDPGILPCPPPEVDPALVSRIYLQKDANSVWQAAHSEASAPVPAYFLDWSDNLESTVWTASSVVRVETVPFTLATGSLGFQMWWASGKGTDEVWGARTSNADPPVPALYPWSPNYATIISANAWLTLQKLEEGGGSLDAKPDTSGYVWNAAAHRWDYVAGNTVRIEPYTAEINVGGKAIYGFNWNLKRQVMTAPDVKNGWWRLTFSTTNNTILFDLDNELGEAVGPTFNPPEGSALAEQAFFPQVDMTNHLTYIDIFLKATKGGGGGGKGGM